MKKLWTWLGAAAGLLSGWAVFEHTALLCVSRYAAAMPGLPRIVQISDLHGRHFGKGQRRLIRKIAALKPEYIMITGDLVSRTCKSYAETEDLLRRLGALAPVIVAEGNHEADLPPVRYAEFRAAVRKSGARYLKNEIIGIGGIHVAGLALSSEYFRGGGTFGFSGAKDCTRKTMRLLLGACPERTLLLAHNPLCFPVYAEWGAALTLSGHVHGGAVRLPLLGGLLSPERKFLPKYDKGKFRIGQSEMIVSGGLGKLRLFNPPEICLITSVPRTDKILQKQTGHSADPA